MARRERSLSSSSFNEWLGYHSLGTLTLMTFIDTVTIGGEGFI